MNILMKLTLLMICAWVQTGKTRTVCESQNKVTINKHLGATFHFQCKSTSSCNEMTFNYTHYSQTGGPDVIAEAPKCTRKLSDFHHGGDYCCSNQCSGNTNVSTSPDCCITVAILPVIQWDLPKAVALNGDPITGSCSASGYPRPNVRLIIPGGCEYQQTNTHIGNYTNKAVFTMNVTKRCEKIYCLIATKTYSLLRINKLMIIENVPSCNNRKSRQDRSLPIAAFSTSVSKDESRLITTKNSEHDHGAVTYGSNSDTTTTCNIVMTAAMTVLLLTFLVH